MRVRRMRSTNEKPGSVDGSAKLSVYNDAPPMMNARCIQFAGLDTFDNADCKLEQRWTGALSVEEHLLFFVRGLHRNITQEN